MNSLVVPLRLRLLSYTHAIAHTNIHMAFTRHGVLQTMIMPRGPGAGPLTARGDRHHKFICHRREAAPLAEGPALVAHETTREPPGSWGGPGLATLGYILLHGVSHVT